MADVFAWSDEDAQQAASRVSAAAKALSDNITDLDAQVKGLTGWDGDEREVYEKIFAHWSESTTSVTSVLTNVSTLITQGNDEVNDFKSEVRKALA